MITLTTDFGLKDPYVAEIKGAILTVNPKATLIDVTHDVEQFNVREAAFTLVSAAPYFPEGTVHLCVVDPGVGTNRRAIAVQTKKAFFVGPDNGVLVLAAKTQSIQHTYLLENPKYMLPSVSNTFHGRDIFAPAAAYLDVGVRPADFGAEIHDPISPQFAPARFSGGVFHGDVLHVDGFGNVVTNVAEKDVACEQGGLVNVEWAGNSIKIPFVKAYGEGKPKAAVALVGSHGFLEIALNQASAAKKFALKVGDKIKVTLV